MRNVIGIDPVFYEYIFTIDGLQLFPTRLSFLVHGRDWLGNTEGKEKKVIITEDEKFDNSMIPRKKFSQYEAEALETASRHSEDVGVQRRKVSLSLAWAAVRVESRLIPNCSGAAIKWARYVIS
ncbi:hypothetical protein B0H11DRAFT_1744996 [Mycena galericulata]|nr:hypothetical protein B0H11DRAFT_1744996 [Mycena galericulata]